MSVQSYRASAVRELTALAGTRCKYRSFAGNSTSGNAKRCWARSPPNLISSGLPLRQPGPHLCGIPQSRAPPPLAVPACVRWSLFRFRVPHAFREVLLKGDARAIALVFRPARFRSRLFEYAKIAILVLLLLRPDHVSSSLCAARFIGVHWCSCAKRLPVTFRPTGLLVARTSIRRQNRPSH